MDLEAFRSMLVKQEHKMKQTHIVLICLNYVEEHPECLPQIGCFWNTEKTFFVHCQIFGEFINRKTNTINRNFRTHGFTRTKTSAAMREKIPNKFNVKTLPDPTNWFQRQCERFTKNTTEDEAINWEFHNLAPKAKIKGQCKSKRVYPVIKNPIPSKNDYNPDDDYFIDDYIMPNLEIDEDKIIGDLSDQNNQDFDFNDFTSPEDHNDFCDAFDDFNIYF